MATKVRNRKSKPETNGTPDLDGALDRYLRSIEVNYRLRRSPDGQTLEEAYAATRKAEDEQAECMDAKDALGEAIIRANGIDPEG